MRLVSYAGLVKALTLRVSSKINLYLYFYSVCLHGKCWFSVHCTGQGQELRQGSSEEAVWVILGRDADCLD